MPFSRYSSDTEQESPESKYWREAKNKLQKSKLTVNEGKVYGCDDNNSCMDTYYKMYDHYDRKQNYLNNPNQPRIDTRNYNPDYIHQDFAYPNRHILFDHTFDSQTSPGNIDDYTIEYDNRDNMLSETSIYQRFGKPKIHNIQNNYNNHSNYSNYDRLNNLDNNHDLFMQHKVAINPLYNGNINNNISKFTVDKNKISEFETFIRIVLFLLISFYVAILIVKSCRMHEESINPSSPVQYQNQFRIP